MVLFADLTGYTALAASLDPEDVYGSLRPGMLELQRVVEGFGGTVPQVLGDGFMAVFGVPAAHEDDAERAVRAALGVRDRTGELRAGGGGVPFPEVHAAGGAALRGGRAEEAWGRLRAARGLLHPPTRLEVVDHLVAEAGMLLDAGRFGPLRGTALATGGSGGAPARGSAGRAGPAR